MFDRSFQHPAQQHAEQLLITTSNGLPWPGGKATSVLRISTRLVARPVQPWLEDEAYPRLEAMAEPLHYQGLEGNPPGILDGYGQRIVSHTLVGPRPRFTLATAGGQLAK